ncbi:MAG: hypothetical protein SFU56_01155 [Capsulimonadales bacterium]|nr:hypothetical protein [Capsulimonadales bacterium]
MFSADHWLRAPTNREIIERWSLGAGRSVAIEQRHRMAIPDRSPADGAAWDFLVLGDTGDSDATGPPPSPQDAVARELARDAASPVGHGSGHLVLHTGDVIYMAGERRLYERNFRRPYLPFLTPESVVDDMVFRLPFLPVPGNHDYYDLGGWGRWLSHIPFLKTGFRAFSQRFLGFGVPEGGSDMGHSFMDAFVARTGDVSTGDGLPLPYVPGERTRVPHRYYRFEYGGTDFFGLDSNTLDGPAPTVPVESVRRVADQRVEGLLRVAQELETRLREERAAQAEQQRSEWNALAGDRPRRREMSEFAAEAQVALDGLATVIETALVRNVLSEAAGKLRNDVREAAQAWSESHARLASETLAPHVETDLVRLDDIGDRVCAALSEIRLELGRLPADSADRRAITAAGDAVERTQRRWTLAVTPGTLERAQRIRSLSEQALDVHRELAQERARQRYQPNDFDAGQLEWFAAALEESERNRPGNWRVLYLHHPLFTTIVNHCESPDVRGLRANLRRILETPGRVHLVLSGHAHAFEWIRAAGFPTTGFFVTGGGGQVALRSSVFTSRSRDRSLRRRQALRAAGVTECAIAGRGPTAPDGEAGPIYHYLRITVRPDCLEVHPVGVRMVRSAGGSDRRFRREEPLPVHHISEIGGSAEGNRDTRQLRLVRIRRDRPPEPVWE